MEIIITDVNNVKVINLIGNLDTNTSPDAEIEVDKLLKADQKKIIFNLEETKFVSSSGLRIFLKTAKLLTANGGALKICNPNTVVKEILDISGFSTILDVRFSIEEALKEI